MDESDRGWSPQTGGQAWWPPPDHYHAATPHPVPSYQPLGAWQPPAPAPVAPVPPPPRPPRRGPRLATVIVSTAVVAVVIGGAAGYGGAWLAQRNAPPAAAPATDPSTASADPTAVGSPRTPIPAAPATANTVAVAKRVLPSTVMIEAGDATGSGFVLDTQGRIITNNHVVAAAAGGTIRVVFSDGRRVKASLLGRSPSYDIAVVKVKASSKLRPLEIGDSDRSQVGESVIAVGSPLGLAGTVTQGIVSAKDRAVVVNADESADAPTAYINAIQTDAPINPGNSGGPLVDSGARVIGVNSAILTLGSGRGQSGSIGLGFAIPINQAKLIGDLLIKKGKATYPVIGARVKDASGGVRLESVDAGGPAGKAGLRTGDVITRIDGHSVSAMEELIVTIRTRRPGQVVVLDYTRDGQHRSARVTLGGKEG